jgi:hypothetical protein
VTVTRIVNLALVPFVTTIGTTVGPTASSTLWDSVPEVTDEPLTVIEDPPEDVGVSVIDVTVLGTLTA